jgi:hypothetical protein
LERIHEQIRSANDRSDEGNGEPVREKLRRFLQAYGIEQSPTESLFDTTARALGIGNREMRAQLLNGTFRVTLSKWAAAREAEIKEACRISETEAALETKTASGSQQG